jgi:tetratricopeptide (TPR) repeat protein
MFNCGMKISAVKIILLSAIAAFLVTDASALDLDMARFATAKKNQVRTLADNLTNKVPAFVWSYFDAVRVDDWETATNLGSRIMRARSFSPTNSGEFPPALQTLIWPPITETIGAYEQFHNWDNQWLHRFGSNIITSIPSGGIYFGGTDPGRFIVSVLKESEFAERPLFVLTQNQLVDSAYLDYLHRLYQDKIYIPTANDVQEVYSNYLTDAQKRLVSGKLKPGEDVRTDESGKVTASGQIAVMEVNALLAKMIIEHNPSHEFYIEESFVLDWMYPQLSPHGLIMELHHKPLDTLREDVLRADKKFWNEFVGELVGNWISDETSIKEICDFDEKVYLHTNFTGFKGSVSFAKNNETQMCFAKLRSSIGGLYVWRMEHAGSSEEKNQMRKAAESAYRQALALCPVLPEAIFRYANFLVELKRTDEAIMIVETATRIKPESPSLKNLLKQLHRKN